MNKIVILINSMSDGGAEKLVQILADNLYNVGIPIEVICLEKNNVYQLNKNINVVYLTNLMSRESGLKKLIYLPLIAYKLERYVKRNNISVVQSHLFRASYVNLLAKLLFKSNHNAQVVNHSIISRYKKQGIIGRVNLFLIQVLYPFADKIISVSNIVQQDMQELFDFKNKKKVIYNMFDLKKIEKLSKEYITDFDFKCNKKYIISVGRLIPLKRNEDLIYALSNLNKNIELLFIGDGSEKINLEKLSNNLNISSRVHFLGWQDNPYKYMRNSDILVCTSQTESFGNIIVEAMACDITVISSRCGGPEEIIDDSVDGFLIDIGDIESLVEKICFVLNNNKLVKLITLNAKQKIKLFAIDKIMEEYKRILEG